MPNDLHFDHIEQPDDVDRFELSPRRAMVIAASFGIFATVLLVGCNTDRWVLALGLTIVGGAAIAAMSRAPLAALLVLSAVTLTAAGLVDCPYAVSYLFVVGLAITASESRSPLWLLAVIGFTVFAGGEVLSETSTAGGEDESLSAVLVIGAGVEAMMLTALVVGLGTAVAVTRRQSREMVQLQRRHHRVAMEAERHRIARDLHDTAAHQLSAIAVRAETADRVGDSEMLREANRFAGRSSKEALAAMRQLVSVLRDQDQDVIQPSVENLAQVADNARQAGVNVTVSVQDGLAELVDRPTELAIVRIVQEALANIVRHSSAKRAEVAVTTDADGAVLVSIEDPGPANADATGSGSGYGIIGMDERAQSVGGTTTIGRTADGGWRVLAQLPTREDDVDRPR